MIECRKFAFCAKYIYKKLNQDYCIKCLFTTPILEVCSIGICKIEKNDITAEKFTFAVFRVNKSESFWYS